MTTCGSLFNLPPLEALAMNYITQVAIAKNDYEKAALLALYCLPLPACDSCPMISTVSSFFWPHKPYADTLGVLGHTDSSRASRDFQ